MWFLRLSRRICYNNYWHYNRIDVNIQNYFTIILEAKVWVLKRLSDHLVFPKSCFNLSLVHQNVLANNRSQTEKQMGLSLSSCSIFSWNWKFFWVSGKAQKQVLGSYSTAVGIVASSLCFCSCFGPSTSVPCVLLYTGQSSPTNNSGAYLLGRKWISLLAPFPEDGSNWSGAPQEGFWGWKGSS
jgi:hypothetical protein